MFSLLGTSKPFQALGFQTMSKAELAAPHKWQAWDTWSWAWQRLYTATSQQSDARQSQLVKNTAGTTWNYCENVGNMFLAVWGTCGRLYWDHSIYTHNCWLFGAPAWTEIARRSAWSYSDLWVAQHTKLYLDVRSVQWYLSTIQNQ